MNPRRKRSSLLWLLVGAIPIAAIVMVSLVWFYSVRPRNASAQLISLWRKANGDDDFMAPAMTRQAVQSALDNGAEINAKDSEGTTALMEASFANHNDVVQLLLAKGADVKAIDKSGETALMWAGGNGDTVRLLLAQGADISARDKDGETVLMKATDSDAINSLLAKGADINAKDKSGGTALIANAYLGSASSVKTLLDHGADINAADNQGNTALTEAASMCAFDTVYLLLARGAKLRTTKDGQTVLMKSYLDDQLVRSLLAHGAEINARDNRGETALIVAADRGDALGVKALLSHGAQLNAKDKLGQTALMKAANGTAPGPVTNYSDVVRLLLAHGADVNTKDKQGQTVLSLATEERNIKIITLLKAAGAR